MAIILITYEIIPEKLYFLKRTFFFGGGEFSCLCLKFEVLRFPHHGELDGEGEDADESTQGGTHLWGHRSNKALEIVFSQHDDISENADLLSGHLVLCLPSEHLL